MQNAFILATHYIFVFTGFNEVQCIPTSLSIYFVMEYIDGLVQDCSNSSVLAMELLQSCIKPSI